MDQCCTSGSSARAPHNQPLRPGASGLIGKLPDGAHCPAVETVLAVLELEEVVPAVTLGLVLEQDDGALVRRHPGVARDERPSEETTARLLSVLHDDEVASDDVPAAARHRAGHLRLDIRQVPRRPSRAATASTSTDRESSSSQWMKGTVKSSPVSRRACHSLQRDLYVRDLPMRV
eukprot:169491-Rhodomonas_salina.2